MFKFAVVIFAVIACAAAKPHFIAHAPLTLAAPAAFIAAAPAPVVTATSSQVIARNYNGIAHAPVIASAPIAAVAPIAHVAAPFAVASAAYATPFVAAAHAPLSYAAPVVW